MQKTKQKPLPGQKSKAAIRERLEKVARRYERLVVLVSEGRTDEMTAGLDGNDAVAFAEFIGFAHSLDSTVIVEFVAGGEETLGNWITGIVARYGVLNGEVQLLQEETLWELFLGRAGMNAFAAQGVVVGLKAPDGSDTAHLNKGGHFGLGAFVRMGFQERVRRFGELLGGTRVLRRVSEVVDRRWE